MLENVSLMNQQLLSSGQESCAWNAPASFWQVIVSCAFRPSYFYFYPPSTCHQRLRCFQ
jgi:hypothetical protein